MQMQTILKVLKPVKERIENALGEGVKINIGVEFTPDSMWLYIARTGIKIVKMQFEFPFNEYDLWTIKFENCINAAVRVYKEKIDIELINESTDA